MMMAKSTLVRAAKGVDVRITAASRRTKWTVYQKPSTACGTAEGAGVEPLKTVLLKLEALRAKNPAVSTSERALVCGAVEKSATRDKAAPRRPTSHCEQCWRLMRNVGTHDAESAAHSTRKIRR
jgi:hypothetical protein